jgi:hypothetical protein
MTRQLSALMVFAMSFAFAGSCFAQSDDMPDEGWEFKVTPYFLAAGLDGKTGVASVTTDIDVPFSEVFDHLDAGFMMAATARRGRWILGLDALYFKLSGADSKTVSGPFGVITVEGTVDLTVTQQLYQPTIAYRAFAESDAPLLDVYVAARYTRLDTEMTLTSTTSIPSFPNGTRQLDGDVSWWDPVIGKRTTIRVTDHLFGTTIVDVGGFGVGSDVTYQWLVAAGWHFTNSISTSAGYRYLKQDYDKDGFVWDMVARGFILGVGIEF